MLIVGPVLGVVLFSSFATLVLAHLAPSNFRWFVCFINHCAMWLQNVAFMPKLKLIFGFFQSVAFLPDVCGLEMPPWYSDWIPFINFFEVDWSGILIPGECLEGGFRTRILLRGVGPLTPIVTVPVIGCAVQIIWDRMRGSHLLQSTYSRFRSAMLSSLQKTLPLVLFIAFIFVAPVSSSIFAAWTCETYELDSIAVPLETTAFLVADHSLQCDLSNKEYSRMVSLAFVFVGIWPIGVPFLFLVVLLRCRSPILKGRLTRLVQSTSFLHKEYVKHFYWWEVLFLTQRMFIIGFVQWIPHTQLFVRTLFGTLVSFGYLVLLFSVKPYRRQDVATAALAVQSAMVLIFLMAQCIQLFTSLRTAYSLLGATYILGFTSEVSLVAAMIATNLTLFAMFILFTLYHAVFGNRVQVLRLSSTGQVPEIGLKRGMQFHLFLSHIWSSGQDQASVIKRRVQLLVPGATIFLDVDDLEGIGELEKHVSASQCVLLFLSRGYFFSPNCLREINSALSGKKPLVLVHESDVNKGGASLDTLRSDCESRDVTEVFNSGGEIIPWHRAADFQLLTLKLIVARMLHCMPAYVRSSAPPKVYIPGEIGLQAFKFAQSVVLYVSDFNPGAKEMITQFAAGYVNDENLKIIHVPPAQLQPGVRKPSRLRRRMSIQAKRAVSGLLREGRSSLRANRNSVVQSNRDSTAGEQLSARDNRLSVTGDPTSGPTDDPTGKQLTHMLLYLNSTTFEGQAGAHLAGEVRRARGTGIAILLVHECDSERGGCQFSKFFETTPPELIADGLYSKKIAVACHPAQHRAISLGLMAKELGAVPKKFNFVEVAEASSLKNLLTRANSQPHLDRRSSSPVGCISRSIADRLSRKASTTRPSTARPSSAHRLTKPPTAPVAQQSATTTKDGDEDTRV